MGFAFHHPIAPFGRQPGEGSSRDLGVRKGAGQELKGVGDTMRLGPVARRRPPGTRAGWADPRRWGLLCQRGGGCLWTCTLHAVCADQSRSHVAMQGRGATDPLRELVHSLIQETQRTPPPPLPVPVAPPAPAVEQEPAPGGLGRWAGVLGCWGRRPCLVAPCVVSIMQSRGAAWCGRTPAAAGTAGCSVHALPAGPRLRPERSARYELVQEVCVLRLAVRTLVLPPLPLQQRSQRLSRSLSWHRPLSRQRSPPCRSCPRPRSPARSRSCCRPLRWRRRCWTCPAPRRPPARPPGASRRGRRRGSGRARTVARAARAAAACGGTAAVRRPAAAVAGCTATAAGTGRSARTASGACPVLWPSTTSCKRGWWRRRWAGTCPSPGRTAGGPLRAPLPATPPATPVPWRRAAARRPPQSSGRPCTPPACRPPPAGAAGLHRRRAPHRRRAAVLWRSRRPPPAPHQLLSWRAWREGLQPASLSRCSRQQRWWLSCGRGGRPARPRRPQSSGRRRGGRRSAGRRWPRRRTCTTACWTWRMP